MIKLAIGVVVTVTLSAVWAMKRANARRRLAEFDQGTRCIACEGTSVAVQGDRVSCGTCGHAASLSELRRVKLTEGEIATMTRPG